MFKMVIGSGKSDSDWMSAYEYVGSDYVVHAILEMIKGTSLSQGIKRISMEDDADVGMQAFGYRTDNFDDFYNWYDWEVGDFIVDWKNGYSLHVSPSMPEIFFWSPNKSVDLNTFFSEAKKL